MRLAVNLWHSIKRWNKIRDFKWKKNSSNKEGNWQECAKNRNSFLVKTATMIFRRINGEESQELLLMRKMKTTDNKFIIYSTCFNQMGFWPVVERDPRSRSAVLAK